MWNISWKFETVENIKQHSWNVIHVLNPLETQRQQQADIRNANRKTVFQTKVSPSAVSLTWSQQLTLILVQKAPAEVEREDRLVQYLLCQHVVKDGVSDDLCERWVGQTQNTVELCCYKGRAGFIHRLSKFLVEDGQITDLEQSIFKVNFFKHFVSYETRETLWFWMDEDKFKDHRARWRFIQLRNKMSHISTNPWVLSVWLVVAVV